MPCTQAVIALAGYGTRRLPITKALEKCMMPVGNRPIIDYIVDDCIAAGITDIIFIVGEQSAQVRTYYGHNAKLEDYLDAIGKHRELAQIGTLTTKARFTFVEQGSGLPYGTSVPLQLAQPYLAPGEPFVFLYGDNIFYNPDGSSQVGRLLDQAAACQASSAMLGVEVPRDLVSRYGIIATTADNGTGTEWYDHIVEKPSPAEAPSNLNNAGCFLLEQGIFPYVHQSIEHSPQQEKYVTDAINWYAQAGNPVLVVRSQAEYLDCGSVEGWLHANNRIVSGT